MRAFWRRHTAAFILWAVLVVAVDGPMWGLWADADSRPALPEWLWLNLLLVLACGAPPAAWIVMNEVQRRIERRFFPDQHEEDL